MVILLRTMLLPLIRRFRRLIASMVAISCLGIALMTGLSGAYYSLRDGFAAYITQYRYPSVVITVAGAPQAALEELSALAGVTQADGRMADDFSLRIVPRTETDAEAKRFHRTVRVFTFPENGRTAFHVWEEAAPQDGLPSLYVEADFAAANDIAAGDTLRLQCGGTYVDFLAEKIVSTPETLSVTQNNAYWGHNADFGYVYLAEASAAVVFPTPRFYRQVLLHTDGTRSDDDILTSAADILSPYRILDSYTYADSPVASRVRVNLEPLRALSLLLPPIFFAVMLLVMLLFLTQILRQCRRDIGILRAFGFDVRTITVLFHTLCFLITLPACLLGWGCGWILLRFTAGMYASAFLLPPFSTHLPAGICLLAVFCTLLTGQLAAALVCRRLCRIRPIEAMRRVTLHGVTPVSDNAVPAPLRLLFQKLSPVPMLKLSAAVVLRNGRRFVFSALCIAMSLMLMVSALSFARSKDFLLEQLFDMRIGYNCQIFLPDETSLTQMQDELTALSGVTRCESLLLLSGTLVCGEAEEEITLQAPVTDSRLIGIPDTRFAPLSADLSPTEILLEMHLANRLGIRQGDTVSVNGHPLTVRALSNQSVSRVQYVSPSTIRSLGNCQYSLLCAAANEEALRMYLEETDIQTEGTVFTCLVREDRLRSFASYDVGVWILLAFAAAMSLLVLCNRMKSNLLEEQYTLATMRVLGVFRWEISASWLLQSLLQFLLAVLTGIPAGDLAAKLILREMSTSKREYPFANGIREYLVSAFLLLLFLLIGHFLSMAQLKRRNLAENSRAME